MRVSSLLSVQWHYVTHCSHLGFPIAHHEIASEEQVALTLKIGSCSRRGSDNASDSIACHLVTICQPLMLQN